jgi:hypothetical protein
VQLPLDATTIQEVAGDDPDPQFATFVIEGGMSKSKRLWGDDVMTSIAEQINKATDPVVGYMGHIPEKDQPYVFPDIQMQWVKAKVDVFSDKVRLVAKAYLLPDTKARDYIKRKLVKTVSPSGDCFQVPIKGGVRVKEFDLKSIDLSRPRMAGLRTALVGVASEMENSEGRKTVEVNEIRGLSEEQLREHNPLLVKAIEEKAQEKQTAKISEMEDKAKNADEAQELISKLREALGLDDKADILDVIRANMEKLSAQGKAIKTKLLQGVLENKFKDESHQRLVARALATEMEGTELPENADEAKVKVTEMVNNFIDSDDEIKKLAVSEQTDAGGGVGNREKVNSGNGRIKMEDGFENEYVTVRGGKKDA